MPREQDFKKANHKGKPIVYYKIFARPNYGQNANNITKQQAIKDLVYIKTVSKIEWAFQFVKESGNTSKVYIVEEYKDNKLNCHCSSTCHCERCGLYSNFKRNFKKKYVYNFPTKQWHESNYVHSSEY